MRLQWYIFRLLAKSFALTLVLVTGTVFLVGSLQAFRRFQDLSLTMLLSRLPYGIPFALTLAIPLALLIGTMYTYGRLAADNEWLALKMGGIHPIRGITPALALGIAFVVLNLWVNGTLSPWSTTKAREITRDDLRNFLESLESSRRTEFFSDRVAMEWQDADDSGALLDLDFKLLPEDGQWLRGHADRARIDRDEELNVLRFTFWDLRATRGKPGQLEEIVQVDHLPVTVEVDSLFSPGHKKERTDGITSDELLFRFTRDPLLGRDAADEKLRRYRTDYAERISLAFACFIFVLVGVPLGLLFRHGSFVGAAIVAILLVFVIYYPLHLIAWNLGFQGTLSPAVAMGIPGGIVGAAGAWLTFLAMRR